MLYRSILASAAVFLVALTLSGCRDSWQNAPTGAPAAPTTDTAPATSTAPTTDTAPATTAPSK